MVRLKKRKMSRVKEDEIGVFLNENDRKKDFTRKGLLVTVPGKGSKSGNVFLCSLFSPDRFKVRVGIVIREMDETKKKKKKNVLNRNN